MANLFDQSFYFLLGGISVTLKFAFISAFFGSVIGIFVGIFREFSPKLITYSINFYVSIFRGTPLLVQLFIFYFAIPGLTGIDISSFTAGIICFSLNSGAYIAEIVRAGIASIDKGQFEAADSFNLTNWQKYRYVILPQLFTAIFPNLINEVVNLIKESSIISVIGEEDLMRRANLVAAESYNFIKPLLIVAIFYYILVVSITKIAKFVENYLKNRGYNTLELD